MHLNVMFINNSRIPVKIMISKQGNEKELIYDILCIPTKEYKGNQLNRCTPRFLLYIHLHACIHIRRRCYTTCLRRMLISRYNGVEDLWKKWIPSKIMQLYNWYCLKTPKHENNMTIQRFQLSITFSLGITKPLSVSPIRRLYYQIILS